MSTRRSPSNANSLVTLVSGRAVELADRDRVADLDAAVEDASDGDAAEVVARVEVGDEHLQRRVEHRRAAAARCRRWRRTAAAGPRPATSRRQRRRARLGAGVEHRKVELLLGRVEIDEEVEDLVQDFLEPRVGPVDLVDDDDRRQPPLERLPQHEAGLRQRPLGRVDQQQHAVDHRERALDFAAEVGVAGGVDDVDQRVAVVDGGVLGEDGDAALALEVGIVHRALGDALVGAENAALVQQGVDERGLAVVDVGDDGDVALNVLATIVEVFA